MTRRVFFLQTLLGVGALMLGLGGKLCKKLKLNKFTCAAKTGKYPGRIRHLKESEIYQTAPWKG